MFSKHDKFDSKSQYMFYNDVKSSKLSQIQHQIQF